MQPFRKFTNSAGGGGVTGLTSASSGTALADNKVVRGDGTTGIQGSGVTLSDTEVFTGTAFKIDPAVNPGFLRFSNAAGTTAIPTELGLLFLYNTFAGGISAYISYDGTMGLYSPSGTHIKFTRTVDAVNGHDAGIASSTAGVVRISDGSTGLGFLQTAGFKRKTADQTVTDSTTLVDDSHLSVSLAAGRSYGFKFTLFATGVVSSQITVQLGGTATHTDLISNMTIFDPGIPGFDSASTLDSTTVGDHSLPSTAISAGTIYPINIEGTTTVNAAGTFLVQFAQSIETGAAETVTLLRGSTLEVWDIQ